MKISQNYLPNDALFELIDFQPWAIDLNYAVVEIGSFSHNALNYFLL